MRGPSRAVFNGGERRADAFRKRSAKANALLPLGDLSEELDSTNEAAQAQAPAPQQKPEMPSSKRKTFNAEQLRVGDTDHAEQGAAFVRSTKNKDAVERMISERNRRRETRVSMEKENRKGVAIIIGSRH